MSSFLLIVVGPVVGSLLLIRLLVLSVRDLADPENCYTRPGVAPRGVAAVIRIGIFLVGLAVMSWRTRDAVFWQERPSVAAEPVATGESNR